MADLTQLERALRNADAAGDEQAARTLAQEIIRVRNSGNGFADKAAGMSETELSVARSKNTPFGKYLRTEAQKPREGETEEARAVRLGGKISGGKDGAVVNTMRAFNQGLTFGAGDELSAGIKAARDAITGEAAFGDSYNQNLTSERARLDQFREDSPITATVAEIAGAIPTAIAMPVGAAGQAASLPARVAAGAGAGAAAGAAYGFNAGEGGEGPVTSQIANRAESAVLPAIVGGGVGAAAPAIGAGVRNITNSMATGSAAREAGLSKPTYQILRQTMEADDALTGAGAQRITQAGPGGMVADAGPTTAGLLDVAVQKSGKAGNTATKAVEQRAAGAYQTIGDALDDVFGKPGQSQSRAVTVYGDKTNPLSLIYKRAYATPIDYASDTGVQIESIIANRVPPSAIKAANNLMRVEGGDGVEQIIARMADDGTVEFSKLPTVRQIDYITRGLREVADQADGKGKLGGTTQTGAAYGNLARDLRSLLKEAVPEYKDALNMAAGKIREVQARKVGEVMLRRSTTRSEVKSLLSDMGDAERRKVGEGVREYIDDTLANVKSAMTDRNMDARQAVTAFRELSSRANREKIADLVGPEAAESLFSKVDEAGRALSLRAAVADNSKTFARQAVDEAVQSRVEDGVIDSLRSGRPVDAAQKAVASVLGRGADSKSRRSDAIYNEIARFLTEPRGPDAGRAIGLLEQAVPRIDQRAGSAGLLTERMMRRNPAVTAPLIQD